MIIRTRVVRIESMRYRTVGDWYYTNDATQGGPVLNIDVADTGNAKYNFLVVQHEINEALLCDVMGITQTEVDNFDKNWERWGDEGEPGCANESPYCKQHMLAFATEIAAADALGVDWNLYEQCLDELLVAYDKAHPKPIPFKTKEKSDLPTT